MIIEFPFYKKTERKENGTKEQLNNILSGAKELLKENRSVKYRSLHPIFSYFVCQNKLDNFSSSMKLINTSDGVL